MRRKRGAFILEIRAEFIKQANFNGQFDYDYLLILWVKKPLFAVFIFG